ncbi:redoxin domain-containing protein [bacterium]|nr:redoxin domain-containing protein [bacterium]
MKKILILLIGFFTAIQSQAQYDIAVKIKGLSCPNELILANHLMDKQYARDTSSVCKDGVFHFVGEKTLETGIYLVVLPDHNYFEIVISDDEDQTKYYFENNTELKPENMVIKGSEENKVFFEFNRFATKKGEEAADLRRQIEAEEDSVQRAALITKYQEVGKEVAAKREEVTTKNPDLFIGKLYKAMKEVTPPEAPASVAKKDVNTWKYLWVRSHYWDNVDHSEDGLVRSPVFHAKIKEYFNSYVPPIADTAIMLADKLIKDIEAAGSRDQFKHTLHYLLRHFQDVKYLCFDKATHYIAANYYCTGKAFWIDSAFKADMCEQAGKMEATLCGKIAPNMNMPDTTFTANTHSLYEVNSPVTIVIFWDHECGHCKKEIPIVKKFYDSCNKEEVFIYAVYTQGDWEGWKKYVREKELNFLNVANAFGEDKFRKHYNITTTPQIYVLNENKEIIFKKVGAANLPDIVQHMLIEQGYKDAEDGTDGSDIAPMEEFEGGDVPD